LFLTIWEAQIGSVPYVVARVEAGKKLEFRGSITLRGTCRDLIFGVILYGIHPTSVKDYILRRRFADCMPSVPILMLGPQSLTPCPLTTDVVDAFLLVKRQRFDPAHYRF